MAEPAIRYGHWRHVFSITKPVDLSAYFKTNELRRGHLEGEDRCLQVVFWRSRQRAMQERAAAQEHARLESDLERKAQEVRLQAQLILAARQAAEEQARFDAEYRARQVKLEALARAERELERQATKDAGWQKTRPRATHHTEYIRRTRVDGKPADYAPVTFALAGGLSCAELERSDIDLLGDLAVPIPGWRSNAHSRRRAFFSRIVSSSRPISLPHAGRAA